jgi:hypothetical protein
MSTNSQRVLLSKFPQKDDSVARFQDATQRAFNVIGSIPILQGTFAFVPEANWGIGINIDIEHKLGRKWVGWFVVESEIDSTINLRNVRSTEENYDETIFLRLKTFAPGFNNSKKPVKLWVF